MLNTTAPVANGPMAALTPPGPAQAGADDGQAFAQALDQAAARQGDAAGDRAEPGGREGQGPKADAAGHARPEANGARPTPGSRAHAARKASEPEGVTAAASALPGDTLALQQAADDSDAPAQGRDADAPLDLAAWVSSLPLPRAPLAATPHTHPTRRDRRAAGVGCRCRRPIRRSRDPPGGSAGDPGRSPGPRRARAGLRHAAAGSGPATGRRPQRTQRVDRSSRMRRRRPRTRQQAPTSCCRPWACHARTWPRRARRRSRCRPCRLHRPAGRVLCRGRRTAPRRCRPK